MVEIYVSTDIETDGPVPGLYSMLSFASAAYTPEKTLVSTFSANLELLPGASSDPKTMDWWKTQSEAWTACRKNLQSPRQAMEHYSAWLNALKGTPVFVAYPLGFDFTFIYWYLIKFTGYCPFGYHGIDIRTYAMAVTKRDYRESSISDMPRDWHSERELTHLALEDAIAQGEFFCNMRIENVSNKASVACLTTACT